MKTNLMGKGPSCVACSKLRNQLDQLRGEFANRDELFNELRRLRAWKHEYDMERLSPPKRTFCKKFNTWMLTGYFK
jgi:hypothetical protein